MTNKDSKDIETNLKTLLSLDSKIKIIPVGRAFDMFSLQYPTIDLLSDDQKHPSNNGTYLAACVVYAVLSGRSAKGVGRRYEGKDANGKKIFYSLVEKSVATKCQYIADQIIFVD